MDVSLNRNGTVLVVADSWNHAVRVLNMSKEDGQWMATSVKTLAGVEGSPGFQDGHVTAAKFQVFCD